MLVSSIKSLSQHLYFHVAQYKHLLSVDRKVSSERISHMKDMTASSHFSICYILKIQLPVVVT